MVLRKRESRSSPPSESRVNTTRLSLFYKRFFKCTEKLSFALPSFGPIVLRKRESRSSPPSESRVHTTRLSLFPGGCSFPPRGVQLPSCASPSLAKYSEVKLRASIIWADGRAKAGEQVIAPFGKPSPYDPAFFVSGGCSFPPRGVQLPSCASPPLVLAKARGLNKKFEA